MNTHQKVTGVLVHLHLRYSCSMNKLYIINHILTFLLDCRYGKYLVRLFDLMEYSLHKWNSPDCLFCLVEFHPNPVEMIRNFLQKGNREQTVNLQQIVNSLLGVIWNKVYFSQENTTFHFPIYLFLSNFLRCFTTFTGTL